MPVIQETDLAIAVLRLQKEVKDIEGVQSRMIEIACDGNIDRNEMHTWGSVAKEIHDLAGAALALVFAGKVETQKEKAQAECCVR